jgi:hypothetical protein
VEYNCQRIGASRFGRLGITRVYALRHHKPHSPDGVRLWSRCDGHVDQELSSGGPAYGMSKPDLKKKKKRVGLIQVPDFPQAINMGPDER